jgi:endonuclease/exonuclease/phosphatase family metal-dependent hydrolase
VPWVDRSSFRQVTYRQADKAVWDQLSDHCPVVVELWIR